MGTATIVDDDPTPTLAISDQTFSEGASVNYRLFPVVLSAPSAMNIQVQCTVTAGTANAADVVLSSTTVFFNVLDDD